MESVLFVSGEAARQEGRADRCGTSAKRPGRLPTGESLQEAIEDVDRATAYALAYYMIDCAHPTHFDSVLTEGGAWRDRIGGLRANASVKSHAELNGVALRLLSDALRINVQ